MWRTHKWRDRVHDHSFASSLLIGWICMGRGDARSLESWKAPEWETP